MAKKIFLLIIILFFYFILFGCISKEDSNDSTIKLPDLNNSNIVSIDSNNKMLDQNVVDNNNEKPIDNVSEEELFCVYTEPKYWYYEETSQGTNTDIINSESKTKNLLNKVWGKRDGNTQSIHEEFYEGGEKTNDEYWTITNFSNNEKIQYHLSEGEGCIFKKINPKQYYDPKVHKTDVTTTEKIIAGYKTYKLKNPLRVYYDKDNNNYFEKDYINKEYCVFFQSFYSDDYGDEIYTQLNLISKLSVDPFDDSIITPPTNCVEGIEDGYLDDDNYDNVDESDMDYDGNYNSSDYDSSDPCIQRCQEMREICQASGQEVNSSGTGCTCTDGTCPYERSCEYTCWSE